MSDSTERSHTEKKAERSIRAAIEDLEVRQERGERQRKIFWVGLAAIGMALTAVVAGFSYYLLAVVPAHTNMRNRQLICIEANFHPVGDARADRLRAQYDCPAPLSRQHSTTIIERGPNGKPTATITRAPSPEPSTSRQSAPDVVPNPRPTSSRVQATRTVTGHPRPSRTIVRTSAPPRTPSPRPSKSRARPSMTPTPGSSCLVGLAGICVTL